MLLDAVAFVTLLACASVIVGYVVHELLVWWVQREDPKSKWPPLLF